ncbi:hypothetical protein BH11ARM2_BH11ARM2_11930 [soil metagenome]
MTAKENWITIAIIAPLVAAVTYLLLRAMIAMGKA